MSALSNDAYYSTTDTGAALSLSSTLIEHSKNASKLFGVNTSVKTDLAGLSLTDFSDTYYANLFLPFDASKLSTGTLLGAIYTQGQAQGGVFGSSSWVSGNSYTANTDFVFYYNGTYVAVYKCIVSVSPSTITPDVDTTHFSYVNQAFKLRLVPAEYSYIPDLAGNERFKHYVTCYCSYIDDTALNYPLYYFVAPGANYYGFAGSSGLRNAVVTDGTNSSNKIIVSGVSATITSNTVTFSHASTGYQKIQVGTKMRIRGLTVSGTSIPFTVTVTSSTLTGFTGTIDNIGTYSAATGYSDSDFVLYSGVVYFHYNQNSSTGVIPTNTSYWKPVTGTLASGTADPIIFAWQVYLDSNFFASTASPSPASSNSSAIANPRQKTNIYKNNSSIINQKQTLFTASDYIIAEGFPFDKNSVTGGSINITASILSNAFSAVTRPLVTTTNTNYLPASENRWIASNSDFGGFAYPANTTYSWASHNGATSRNLKAPNDASNTYIPDLLDGSGSNPGSNLNQLKLTTPDASTPPLSSIASLSFSGSDFLYTDFNPFKINGSVTNEFTTFLTAYLDYIPSSQMNSSVSSEETNWYSLMSEAELSGTWSTDLTNLKAYTQFQPRLSVRYRYDGTITLNLGDTILTALKVANGMSRPFQPVIVGLTIKPPVSSAWTAVLTVVDKVVHRKSVTFYRNWLGGSAVTPTNLLYGATPFNNRFHGAKMYVLEINNYYATHTDSFYDSEIQKMDIMYAVTSGRVS